MDSIYEQFASKMTRHEWMSRETKQIHNERLVALQKMQRADIETGEENEFCSCHYMPFRNVFDGSWTTLGRKNLTVEELIGETGFILNRQLQWILVAAYEDLEQFLIESYAYLGMHKPEIWQASDFGTVSISEINGKDFDWFRTQAKNKKNGPLSILTRYRTYISGFASYEKSNRLEMNYRFMIVLISKMRHLVVHADGSTSDLDNFASKALDASECTKKGDEKYDEMLRSYFSLYQGRYVLNLLDEPLESGRLRLHFNVIRDLLNALASYGHMTKELIKNAVSPEHELPGSQLL